MIHRFNVVVILATAWAPIVTLASPPETATQTGPKRSLLAADDGKRTIALLDGNGKVLWKHSAGPFHDAQLLGRGNVTSTRVPSRDFERMANDARFASTSALVSGSPRPVPPR